MTTKVKTYLVESNGLSGTTEYHAANPDEALMFAYRYERFLRLTRNRPDLLSEENIPRVRQIVKDECEIPDFHITSCILEEDD